MRPGRTPAQDLASLSWRCLIGNDCSSQAACQSQLLSNAPAAQTQLQSLQRRASRAVPVTVTEPGAGLHPQAEGADPRLWSLSCKVCWSPVHSAQELLRNAEPRAPRRPTPQDLHSEGPGGLRNTCVCGNTSLPQQTALSTHTGQSTPEIGKSWLRAEVFCLNIEHAARKS